MKPKRNFIAGKIMLLVIFLCNVNLNGQDIIIKNNGDEIKSKVIEIDSRVIKYRAFDNVNGPLYILNKAEIFMIKYENGSKEIFGGSRMEDNSSDDVLVDKNQKTKKVEDSSNYALINFYRYYNQGFGSAYKWYIIIDSKPIWQIKEDRRVAVKVFQEGTYKISVDIGPFSHKWSNEVDLNIKLGKVYYVKFSRKGGMTKANKEGKHLVTLMSNNLGELEFESLKGEIVTQTLQKE